MLNTCSGVAAIDARCHRCWSSRASRRSNDQQHLDHYIHDGDAAVSARLRGLWTHAAAQERRDLQDAALPADRQAPGCSGSECECKRKHAATTSICHGSDVVRRNNAISACTASAADDVGTARVDNCSSTNSDAVNVLVWTLCDARSSPRCTTVTCGIHPAAATVIHISSGSTTASTTSALLFRVVSSCCISTCILPARWRRSYCRERRRVPRIGRLARQSSTF